MGLRTSGPSQWMMSGSGPGRVAGLVDGVVVVVGRVCGARRDRSSVSTGMGTGSSRAAGTSRSAAARSRSVAGLSSGGALSFVDDGSNSKVSESFRAPRRKLSPLSTRTSSLSARKSATKILLGFFLRGRVAGPVAGMLAGMLAGAVAGTGGLGCAAAGRVCGAWGTGAAFDASPRPGSMSTGDFPPALCTIMICPCRTSSVLSSRGRSVQFTRRPRPQMSASLENRNTSSSVRISRSAFEKYISSV